MSRFRTLVASAAEPAARAQWEGLCSGSQQRTVFSDLAFGEAVCEAMGMPVRLALALEGERPRAGAMIFMRHLGPYRAASHPVFSTVHSPVLDAPLSEADLHHGRTPLDALLDLLASEVHQATFSLHPSLHDARAFTWRGWRMRPAYTYQLALKAGRPVTESWSDTPRRMVRMDRDSFAVEEDPAAIPEIVALIQASHARQEQPLGAPPKAVLRLSTRLAAAGLARPFVAHAGAEAHAGTLILSDGRTAYFWMAGSRPGPAMTILLAEALERLRDEGVRHFDFAGANTASIAEFKRKLGGALIPYFRARMSTRPELRLIDRLRWG